MVRLLCFTVVAIILKTWSVAADEVHLGGRGCDGPHCEDESPTNTLLLMQTQLRFQSNMTIQNHIASTHKEVPIGSKQHQMSIGSNASLPATTLNQLSEESYCPDPVTIQLPTNCEEDVVTPENVEFCTPKNASVFGVYVRATWVVPNWALDYARDVLTQYLDSDGDGVADDPRLIESLKAGKPLTGFLLLRCRGEIGRGEFKNSWYGIARIGEDPVNVESAIKGSMFERSLLEEFHHGIYHGLQRAYPAVFDGPMSVLGRAVTEAIGTCEDAHTCAPTCDHYNCQNSYDCTFEENSCDGVFHYAEPSCNSGCLVTEGFWHAFSTAFGYKCGPNGQDGLKGEWEVCTAAELESNPKTTPLYKLVTNRDPSQEEFGYRLPTVLPGYTAPNSSVVPPTKPTPPTPAPPSTGDTEGALGPDAGCDDLKSSMEKSMLCFIVEAGLVFIFPDKWPLCKLTLEAYCATQSPSAPSPSAPSPSAQSPSAASPSAASPSTL